MNTAAYIDRERIVVLWVCLILFLLRVLGQVEVLLLAPPWLPPMDDWYSGLLPYPLLLPAQIILLMVMTAIATMQGRISWPVSSRARQWMRVSALLYFAVMASRLCIQFALGAPNALAAGGIPIAFHWILAMFLYTLARPEHFATTSSAQLVGDLRSPLS
ncbi:hypothetical protein HNQ60_005285 [Povalibacter uvarum]|uniref:Uncharacterized protein n=1 Tax=Povalibacter uvarum TaxID=732238 RepID=A0A841HU77_9GAMM|nr:hypothetical protein [Povalibacter uvarum]MBB6096363.1 hypothetical protein [Povalibacter uvarum]